MHGALKIPLTKYCLILLTTLCCMPAVATTPLESRHARQTVTLEFLFEACTVIGETAYGMIPHFDCETFIYGVLDAHLAVRDSLPEAAQSCFPAEMAPWQVYEQLMSADIESLSQKPAADAILEILKQDYPCH